MSQKHAPSMHHRRRAKKTRVWNRHPEDWYIEEEWVNDRLFEVESFEGRVHDPACGSGRIVRAARRAGLRATGSDIVLRAKGFRVADFFQSTKPVDNIACNLPFRFAMAFVGHALNLARRKVAMIVPTGWVNGNDRSQWLERTPLRRVYHLSPRPSMPPGPVVMADKQKIGNGTTDYSWAVWEHGYVGRPELCFLRRGGTSPITSVPAPGSAAHLLPKEPS
ncbi:hypothetical protein [Bradyrhizobium sp. BR 10261]|uniref:hypothetical protein n=1 Tax=Bradyrhizobium sp. BR 10261 TaxID=2749992 RepID=UPI001C64F18D|nr:hypothetical protein [Bradyrhizobium sp. BR 10261]MBW7965354.1 hypothetical protein [Bradyrhizobium sp. BR 10261]